MSMDVILFALTDCISMSCSLGRQCKPGFSLSFLDIYGCHNVCSDYWHNFFLQYWPVLSLYFLNVYGCHNVCSDYWHNYFLQPGQCSFYLPLPLLILSFLDIYGTSAKSLFLQLFLFVIDSNLCIALNHERPSIEINWKNFKIGSDEKSLRRTQSAPKLSVQKQWDSAPLKM